MSASRTYTPTERLGVVAVEQIVVRDLAWIWREQAISDFGVDGHIELVDAEKRPTGQLIAVQVKSGASYFERENPTSIVFYLEPEHWNYWSEHSLPVILVLHNPDTAQTIWEWVDEVTVTPAGKTFRIEVPKRNLLTAGSRGALERRGSFSGAAVRRRRFQIDRDLIRQLVDREVYVSFELWVNKSLTLRGVEIRLDDPDKEADFEFGWFIPSSDIGGILWHYMPWLEIDGYHSVTEHDGEVEIHTLRGTLSSAAAGYLALEDYLAHVKEAPELPSLPESPEDDIGWGYDYRDED